MKVNVDQSRTKQKTATSDHTDVAVFLFSETNETIPMTANSGYKNWTNGMKRYNDLNESKKKYAVHRSLQELIHDLLLGKRVLDDPELTALVKEGYARTNQMRQEWRGADWLYEEHGDRFRPIAEADAIAGYYPEDGERVLYGFA